MKKYMLTKDCLGLGYGEVPKPEFFDGDMNWLLIHNDGRFATPWATHGECFVWWMNKVKVESHVHLLFRDLTIVTIHNYKKESMFEKSCCKNGFNVKVCRVDGKWNHFYKISYLHQFIRDNVDTKFVLFADARDVFMFNPWTVVLMVDMMRCLEEQGGIVMFGGDRIKFPADTTCDTVRGLTGPFPHLNSGMYIGSRERIVQCLEYGSKLFDICPNHTGDDQEIWHHIRDRFDFVDVDDKARYFKNAFGCTQKDTPIPLIVRVLFYLRPYTIIKPCLFYGERLMSRVVSYVKRIWGLVQRRTCREPTEV